MKNSITLIFLRIMAIFFPVSIVKSRRARRAFTQLWHQIWLEEHYASKGEPIVKKYAKFDEHSVDFLVKFLWVFPAGTMRLIWNNRELGLPTTNDFKVTPAWKTDRLLEVTLLTVSRRFRRVQNIPFMILMKALYWYLKRNHFEGIVVGADRRLFYLLTRGVKLPLKQIGRQQHYEGSITIPAYMPMENLEYVLGEDNPLLAGFIFE